MLSPDVGKVIRALGCRREYLMPSKQSTSPAMMAGTLKEFVARVIMLDLLDGFGHIVHGEVGGHLVHGVTYDGLHLVVSSRYEHHPLNFSLGCKSTHSSHSEWATLRDAAFPLHSRDSFTHHSVTAACIEES
jgi:hypothetical protein